MIFLILSIQMFQNYVCVIQVASVWGHKDPYQFILQDTFKICVLSKQIGLADVILP